MFSSAAVGAGAPAAESSRAGVGSLRASGRSTAALGSWKHTPDDMTQPVSLLISGFGLIGAAGAWKRWLRRREPARLGARRSVVGTRARLVPAFRAVPGGRLVP